MIMHANPLASRLIGNPSHLSLRACFWLVFGLGLTTLALSTSSFLNDRAPLIISNPNPNLQHG